MKFNNLIATIAIISLASQASAQDGTLRRAVAQNDVIESAVIVNTNSNSTSAAQAVAAPAPSQQPATVVEAQPVVESKAEALRKQRIGAEVSTEQKIVEKLEESRLREEQDRADRLFGSKLDPAQAKALEEAAASTGSGKTVAPVPTQVTIEKIEIMQPAQPAPEIISVKEVAPPAAIAAPAPAAATSSASASASEDEGDKKGSKLYVNGSLGALNYEASNVKGNFGGGFAVGILANERTAVEASFLYSNHFIDTFWNPGIYRELDQYDIGINAKYYILNTRLKPFVGAGLAYITRSYSQRIVTSSGTVAGPSDDSTTAINLGLMLGADFQINDTFMIGGGFDYSSNLTNTNEFDFQNYGILPENTKPLEEIAFWTLKVTGTLTF